MTGVQEVAELSEVASELELATAPEVVAWAHGRFGPGLVLTASFQDCVLIDVATSIAPALEVVFIDTGFHFPETLSYVEQVRRRYRLNLRVVAPEVGPDVWPCGTEWCCQTRKVAPLDRVLAERTAWMTGLRRVETPERAGAKVVSWDAGRGMVKVNPLVNWTDEDVTAYAAERELPVHPLTNRGYASIGCAPTTTPLAQGEDPRSGRWRGSAKTECGLHSDGSELYADRSVG